LTDSQKALQAVTPAKAGVQKFLVFLDSGFRRNDRKGRFLTSYETVKFALHRSSKELKV
jgi:hypothetical protein